MVGRGRGRRSSLKAPVEHSAQRRDLRDGGADVGGASGGDLVPEVLHVAHVVVQAGESGGRALGLEVVEPLVHLDRLHAVLSIRGWGMPSTIGTGPKGRVKS